MFDSAPVIIFIINSFMENIYYRKLCPPVELKPWNFGSAAQGATEFTMTMDMINVEVHEWLLTLGLKIVYPRCLFKAAGRRGMIHIDCQKPKGNQYARLNWVFGGKNSRIEWFDLLPAKVPTPTLNPVNEYIDVYKESDCKPICSTEFDGLYLINTGIPHRVVGGDYDRYCYAFFLQQHGRRIEWSEAVSALGSSLVSADCF